MRPGSGETTTHNDPRASREASEVAGGALSPPATSIPHLRPGRAANDLRRTPDTASHRAQSQRRLRPTQWGEAFQGRKRLAPPRPAVAQSMDAYRANSQTPTFRWLQRARIEPGTSWRLQKGQSPRVRSDSQFLGGKHQRCQHLPGGKRPIKGDECTACFIESLIPAGNSRCPGHCPRIVPYTRPRAPGGSVDCAGVTPRGSHRYRPRPRG